VVDLGRRGLQLTLELPDLLPDLLQVAGVADVDSLEGALQGLPLRLQLLLVVGLRQPAAAPAGREPDRERRRQDRRLECPSQNSNRNEASSMRCDGRFAARTQGAFVAGGYGRDRGRGSGPSSAARRLKHHSDSSSQSQGGGLFTQRTPCLVTTTCTPLSSTGTPSKRPRTKSTQP